MTCIAGKGGDANKSSDASFISLWGTGWEGNKRSSGGEGPQWPRLLLLSFPPAGKIIIVVPLHSTSAPLMDMKVQNWTKRAERPAYYYYLSRRQER
jgi:hypothetical protein